MKHISFDESSVMGEFAKIMNEQKIVKIAEEQTQSDKDLDELLKSAPEQTKQLPQGFISPYSELIKNISTNKPGNQYRGIKAPGNYVFLKDGKYLEVSQKDLDIGLQQSQDKALIAMWDKIKKDFAAKQLAQKSEDGAVEKTAAAKSDSVYDVTGETGKDLIDSAHPGKTKTDVDSKGDGSLVETVVEQQKKDLEIANKMPTGKYAELTTELTKLANKLDEGGFLDAADKVDELIKKVAVSYDDYFYSSVELSNKFLDELLKKNNSLYEGRMIVFPAKVVERLTKLKNHVFADVEKSLNELYSLDTDGTFQSAVANVRMKLADDISNLTAKGLSIDVPKTGPTVQTVEKGVETITMPEKVVPKLKWWQNPDKVRAFRMKYNESIKGTPRDPLSLSGPFGKEDSKAANEVYNVHKGFNGFRAALQSKPPEFVTHAPETTPTPTKTEKVPDTFQKALKEKEIADHIKLNTDQIFKSVYVQKDPTRVPASNQDLYNDIYNYVKNSLDSEGKLSGDQYQKILNTSIKQVNEGVYNVKR